MHILIFMTYLLSSIEQTFFFFLSVGKKNRVRKDAQNHETSNVKSTAGTKSEGATDVENPKAEAGNQVEVWNLRYYRLNFIKVLHEHLSNLRIVSTKLIWKIKNSYGESQI